MICKIFGLKIITNINKSNFHPLEVLVRCSEKQLQVGENLVFNVALQGLLHCAIKAVG